ncbi:cysteine proteinase [Coniophora puteana RWD-64-598 SS2]|uniref:Ubiquitin carboxyl-terminal hydrolase n=1 Tax=Coniophora puteana (strain RWD-64-598) TaxID=741705 RepID=A0A5M3MX33_CONPW|nr:cysteine proteinase [Coniophora puteana RWD-64-598 SS2]EIW83703.1 cysteine proteinase [Coniophora puteana RWD-64-598 SS2]
MSSSPESTLADLLPAHEDALDIHALQESIQAKLEEDLFETDTGACSHIVSLLTDVQTRSALLAKYKTVVAWRAKRQQDAIRPSKRRKVGVPTCDTCYMTLARPFVCLSCSFGGCWAEGHMVDHLRESGHSFCADTRSGSVYCADCEDFIFNDIMDEARLQTQLAVEETQSMFQVSKMSREPYKPHLPSSEDTDLLKSTAPLPCQSRRGLLNLGQTCFMNVVLQAFVHNPLLRGFFLADKHNARLCKNTDCTCCEMDALFSEVYAPSSYFTPSGAPPPPFGPTSFLATTWKTAKDLSGHAQQDAHEFFISALNQIHATARGSTNVSCNCIVHSTFAGQLQSDVTCERCGNTTSTVDMMLDISLELRGSGNSKGAGGREEGNTLASCLNSYTKPEKLGSKDYTCSNCTSPSHDATKRLSFRKLPPILSFQFKRFEHRTPAGHGSAKAGSGAAAVAMVGVPTKLDAPIRFPAGVNMAPWTAAALGSGSGAGLIGKWGRYPGPDAMYEYDLFAVINHEGAQMDQGHYTNYARSGDEWYRFDDDKVTPSTLSHALSSHHNAYMCFYAKRHLDYKPHTKPSYRLTRESDIVRELQAMAENGGGTGTGAGAGRVSELELELELGKDERDDDMGETDERDQRDREREKMDADAEAEAADAAAARMKEVDDALLDLVGAD